MASISDVQPNTIPIGDKVGIQILGSGLEMATAVYFVDSPGTKVFASTFEVRSDKHINAVMPLASLAPGRIHVFVVIGNTVVTAQGKEREGTADQWIRKITPPVNCIVYGKLLDPSNPDILVWDPGPRQIANINAVYPRQTSRIDSTNVEIIGEGFAKATGVYFVDASNTKVLASKFKLEDDQRITTVTPSLCAGKLHVFVVTGDTEATVGWTNAPPMDAPSNMILFGMILRNLEPNVAAGARYDWVIAPGLESR